MKSMETGRQDGGSDKNHAPFSVGKTGNISRKFLTIILKIFDKNFERLQGRGFAVVASEIGKLSESSRDAAVNIQSINSTVIGTVQELIKNANALVTYMEQNILPDYDNFVCAGAQYNDDAVYINEVVEKFHQMAADLKQRTESVMEYISQIQRAVEEGSEGINLAAKNTATLSEEISHISSQIMYNKKIADVLSEEAEHFI